MDCCTFWTRCWFLEGIVRNSEFELPPVNMHIVMELMETQGLGPHRELPRNGRARLGALPATLWSSPLLFSCLPFSAATNASASLCILGEPGPGQSLFAMEVTSPHCPAWLCSPHWVPRPPQECTLHCTTVFGGNKRICLWTSCCCTHGFALWRSFDSNEILVANMFWTLLCRSNVSKIN